MYASHQRRAGAIALYKGSAQRVIQFLTLTELTLQSPHLLRLTSELRSRVYAYTFAETLPLVFVTSSHNVGCLQFTH
jgi:hypothetical protein